MPTKPESSTFVALSQAELHAYIDAQIRQVVRILFEQVLEEELTAMLQAAPYERNGMRLGQRNGSYMRDLVTKFGRIVDLRVPRERRWSVSDQVVRSLQTTRQGNRHRYP